MFWRWITCFFFILLISPLKSADSLEVSLITIGPGSDLYSIYGHTGLRINNITKASDVVYNYGTFDFDEGNFYLKFIRGKLMYRISKSKFTQTIKYYQSQNRSITEQYLDLSTQEKAAISSALYENYKPANRKYLYDFFYDNCSTRIRDMLANNTRDLQWKAITPRFTFRDLLKQYHGGWEWYDFGVDLIVGANADRLMTNTEEMYLPDYLYSQADGAFNEAKPLVSKVNPIHFFIKDNPRKERSFINPWSGPVIIALFFVIIQLMLLVLFFMDKPISWAKWIDGFMLGLFGIAGCIVLFMWFGTDHQSTKHNYNLLWLNPLFLLVMGAAKPNRLKSRLLKHAILLALLIFALIVFMLGMQFVHFGSILLIVAMILLLVRKTLKLQKSKDA